MLVSEIPLDRDLFLRSLLRHLARTLQSVEGVEAASGLVSVVDQEMGNEINQAYKHALGVNQLDAAQTAQVLVNLKRTIERLSGWSQQEAYGEPLVRSST